MDILSLHVRFADLVAQALVILEDYDCETVGDPQTAVSHIGNIVIFLQTALSRYYCGERKPNPSLLTSAVAIYRMEELSSEDIAAFNTWHKALFDSGSEGIEDSILRSTRPKNLLRIAATLVSHAIIQCAENKLDKDVLNNGISYFLSPLLNWTLVGVIKTLLLEVQHRYLAIPIQLHVEILQTLLQSSSCPKQVLKLSAAAILRSLPENVGERKIYPFDTAPIRQIALRAMGVSVDDATTIPFTLEGRSLDPSDFVKHAIQEAFASARAKKAPALDVDRCLLMVTPARFLAMLWAELMVVSAMGQLTICRRIATYVLSTPRSARSPPLLPIFLHLSLPSIIESADRLMAAEQAIAVELLVAVISSALTAALYVEWALQSVCKEKRLVLGQTALAMARRLSGDLRRKGHGPVGADVVQRLVSNAQFMANFPTFTGDM
ncbi:hypothetical protein EIP86_010279 [Pleurotus ostreatoroseus]|nr:hypothetical protein EIP86_010279 [Pleurotus ostreatoroseus]